MRERVLGSMICIVASAALLVGCRCGASDEGPVPREKQQKDPPGLKLVVLLVIDQLPSWTFTRDAGQLTGGIARLLNESVFFDEARLPYGNSYTAPGHAMFGTGAGPRLTGILANGWIRDDAYVESTGDATFPLYDTRGGANTQIAARGASSANLRIDGVADVLAREAPQARSVAVALKQRAAILMLGKKPTRAVWYEGDLGVMTTSAFYGEPPAWLHQFNRDMPVERLLTQTWSVSDGDFLGRYLGVKDDAPGEGAGFGFTTSFPHRVTVTEGAGKAFRLMPASIDYVLGAATAAIDGEKLGQRGVVDLLGVSLGTLDYVGHFWGQESWERFDTLRQIDRALQPFLADLDRRYGKEGWALVLTSDHGAVPLIERSLASGRSARRITPAELDAAVTAALKRVVGAGSFVAGYDANAVYLNRAFKVLPAKKQEAAISAIIEALVAVPNVALAMRTSDLGGDCTRHDDDLWRLMCESIDDESGDITVVPDRYSLFQDEAYSTGTSHGTPSPECLEVPILVRAPGIAQLRSIARVTAYQIAPTLADLLAISPPLSNGPEPLRLVPDPTDAQHIP